MIKFARLIGLVRDDGKQILLSYLCAGCCGSFAIGTTLCSMSAETVDWARYGMESTMTRAIETIPTGLLLSWSCC